VITIDGRTYQGTLLALDNATNLVLTSAEERVIQPTDSEENNSINDTQVLLIRGDLVLICGLVDEEMDNEIDWLKVRGGPIGGTKHI
jgi:U6 snRNA-associated Sm-like protein LSm8